MTRYLIKAYEPSQNEKKEENKTSSRIVIGEGRVRAKQTNKYQKNAY
jgi:hypothetical protein